MAITTSENIGQVQPTRCHKCGHRGGLMTLNANNQEVHFDDCPEGTPEPDPVTLIAHDPLDPNHGYRREVRANALRHLQENGENLSLTKAVTNRSGNHVHALTNPAGREDSSTREQVVLAGGVIRTVKQSARPADDLLAEAERYERIH